MTKQGNKKKPMVFSGDINNDTERKKLATIILDATYQNNEAGYAPVGSTSNNTIDTDGMTNDEWNAAWRDAPAGTVMKGLNGTEYVKD